MHWTRQSRTLVLIEKTGAPSAAKSAGRQALPGTLTATRLFVAFPFETKTSSALLKPADDDDDQQVRAAVQQMIAPETLHLPYQGERSSPAHVEQASRPLDHVPA
jgi:hypothetical protein